MTWADDRAAADPPDVRQAEALEEIADQLAWIRRYLAILEEEHRTITGP